MPSIIYSSVFDNVGTIEFWGGGETESFLVLMWWLIAAPGAINTDGSRHQ